MYFFLSIHLHINVTNKNKINHYTLLPIYPLMIFKSLTEASTLQLLFYAHNSITSYKCTGFNFKCSAATVKYVNFLLSPLILFGKKNKSLLIYWIIKQQRIAFSTITHMQSVRPFIWEHNRCNWSHTEQRVPVYWIKGITKKYGLQNCFFLFINSVVSLCGQAFFGRVLQAVFIKAAVCFKNYYLEKAFEYWKMLWKAEKAVR